MPNTRYRVVVTAEARADLAQIGACLGLENPVVALRIVRQLRLAASELGDRAMR